MPDQSAPRPISALSADELAVIEPLAVQGTGRV